MVMSKPERYDFIGLSTDTKPTPETSERVVNGSTYYTADDSKLYVFCDGEWYEREPLGGTGIPTDVVDNFWFGTRAEYDAISPKAEKTLYLIRENEGV